MIYSCLSFLSFEGEYGWIWSREKTLSKDKINKFKDYIKKHGAHSKDFENIKQNKCPKQF